MYVCKLIDFVSITVYVRWAITPCLRTTNVLQFTFYFWPTTELNLNDDIII
jgi:hypothetical protein